MHHVIQILQYMMQDSWLLFVIQEGPASGAGRSRIWRALKALGAAVLRDGVYVLPANPDTYASLNELQGAVLQGGGSANVFVLPTETNTMPTAGFPELFDRGATYDELIKAASNFTSDVFGLDQTEAEIRRALRSLQRELAAIRAIDYFPTQVRERAALAVRAAEDAFAARFSPGEPHAEARLISLLNAAEYQQRTWATRRHLWVDRVASAWLITRKIDPAARFQWLASPADCPADVLGFDFDGAAFTHVGGFVTFEVLVYAFGLDGDSAILRLAALVHSLDVADGLPSPEAAGFEAVLAGARDTCSDDDHLIAAMFPVLDLLYAGFRRESKTRGFDA
jgi:hypothetical protein